MKQLHSCKEIKTKVKLTKEHRPKDYKTYIFLQSYYQSHGPGNSYKSGIYASTQPYRLNKQFDVFINS